MIDMLVIGTLSQYTVNMETIGIKQYLDNWPDRYLFIFFQIFTRGALELDLKKTRNLSLGSPGIVELFHIIFDISLVV